MMPYVASPHKSVTDVRWQCQFADDAEVAAMGGTLAGTPTPTALHGLYMLGGTAQRAEFLVPGRMLLQSGTIRIEVEPSNIWTYDVRYFDTDDTAIEWSFNVASSGNIQVKIAGTIVLTGVVTPSWHVGQRNLIHLVFESGSQSLYVNGALVASGSVAYSLGELPTKLFVGSTSGTGTNFEGVYKSISFMGYQYSAWDVAEDYVGTLWDYRNRTVCWLDMATKDEPAFKQTRDRSRVGCHGTLGNGAGLFEPDFLDPGYETVGTEYLTIPKEAWNRPGEVGIFVGVRPSFKLADGSHRYLLSPETFLQAFRFSTSNQLLMAYNSLSTAASQAQVEPYWRESEINILGFTAVEAGGAKNTKLWVNGNMVKAVTSTYVAAIPPNDIHIGIRSDGSLATNGRYVHVSFFDRALTELQAMDLSHYIREKYASKV
jgi:hypothetical protein